jgi:Uma2 family endonuclease
MSSDTENLLTAEEFQRLADDGVPKELVRGKVEVALHSTPRHGLICGNIVGVIRPFVIERRLGRMLCNDSAIQTERSPDTVRGADVAYYSFARLPQGPIPPGYLDVVPELVFEVRLRSDRWRMILARAMEYLDAGVTTVCVVDPTSQVIHAYNSDAPDRMFKADEDFTLPEVLAGFSAPVRLFFA